VKQPPSTRTSRLRLVLALVVVLLAVVGTASLYLYSGYKRTTALAAAVPERPPLDSRPPGLHELIASTEEKVRSGPDPVAALEHLALVYHANGFLAEAAHCYEALHALGAPGARWPYRHAFILAGFGESTRAAELFRLAARREPSYLPARVKLGDILLKSGDVDAAARVYAAILADKPDEPYALFGQARCEIERDDWARARHTLERLVAVTNYALGYDLIVSAYERLGMHERATALRGEHRAWGSFRDIPDPWMEELLLVSFDAYQLSLAAGAAQGRGDLVTARKRLERAIACSPESAQLYYQLGVMLVSAKEYTKAREALENCTRLAPDFPDGWSHLSGLYATLGDNARSDRALEQGLAHCPDSPGLHMMRARRHQDAGRIEAAIADLRAAIHHRPTEPEAYVELAVLLVGQKREAEAMIEFERALGAEPDHPFALSCLAMHAVEQGDRAAADAWIRRMAAQPRVTADQREGVVQNYVHRFGTRP
jgi:tetratricopeptide (TPR) repeat protein